VVKKMDENEELVKEINNLKKEINELKKEIDILKYSLFKTYNDSNDYDSNKIWCMNTNKIV
jgi:cell division protein FtsB